MSASDPLTNLWAQVIAHLEVVMRQDSLNQKASLVQHMIQSAGPCPDHLGDRLRKALTPLLPFDAATKEDSK